MVIHLQTTEQESLCLPGVLGRLTLCCLLRALPAAHMQCRPTTHAVENGIMQQMAYCCQHCALSLYALLLLASLTMLPQLEAPMPLEHFLVELLSPAHDGLREAL